MGKYVNLGGIDTNQFDIVTGGVTRMRVNNSQFQSVIEGGSTLLPLFGCRAWVNFNGVPVSGTYTRTGTLVTVTITSHGLSTGMRANLDFTSGTATDGTYVVTVTDVNTFTITDTASGSTSGNVTANIRIRAGGNIANVVRNTNGDYTVSFTTAMPDANYSAICTSRSAINANQIGVFGVAHVGITSTPLSTTSVRVFNSQEGAGVAYTGVDSDFFFLGVFI